MKIEPREITVRDLADDYADNDEDGVVGYDGKLDIRPPYGSVQKFCNTTTEEYPS